MESSSAINYQIKNSPEAACLIFNLQPLQKVFVKTSTLTAKDSSLEIGEIISTNSSDVDTNFSIDSNLNINEIKAPKLPGSLYLFPDILGAIKHCPLNSQAGIIAQIFSFLACSENIQLQIISFPIIKQISERDSFFLYLLGNGDLWLSFYGNLQEISVKGNYLINISYLVAFEDTLTYEIKQIEGLSVSGLHTGTVGDNNLFCHFQGTGKLWIQSRHRYAFLNFFAPFIH